MNPRSLLADPDLGSGLARGRTLPASWYTDPAIFALERERVFRPHWQYVGLVDKVSRPGDFLTCRVGEVPVVIVRDEKGALKAFVNVCGHRGSELVLQPCGNRKTLQCHYHAWTWGLDGCLRAAPRSQEQPGFDKGDYPLQELRLEAFGPFLFVHTDQNAPALSTVLGELPELIRQAGADLHKLKFRQRIEYPMACNWKVVVENFLECYHCLVSHPGFSGLIDLDKYQVTPYRYFSTQRGPLKESAKAQRSEYYDAHAVKDGIYNFLWPNFMCNFYPGAGNASTNHIIPIDENHCVAVYEFFYSDDMSEKEQQEMTAFIDQVQREDIVICESVQRGLRSGYYAQGQLILSRENGIQHFQRLVYDALSS
jgi:choline monooxygenase